MPYAPSILRKSGQWWKLAVAFWGMLLGSAAVFFGSIHLTPDGPVYPLFLVLSGLSLSLGTFVFACRSIRCSNCGSRWLWTAITAQKAGNWLRWLLSNSTCPKCQQ